MKNRFYAVLLALLASCVPATLQAQVTLYLSIPNTSTISSVSSTGVPTFSISGANALVSQYNVTGFMQLSPNHRFEFMRHVYSLQCRDAAFADALKHGWPSAFPYYEQQENNQLLSYYPNDWGYGNYLYLDYIGMPTAWGITKGDTGTVIGISDNYFDMANPDLQNFKVKRLATNNRPTSAFDFGHGTTVAGIAAGGTDNSYAYPGVGFNCRLDLTGASSTSMLAGMSERGCAAVNGSWGAYSGFDLDYILNNNIYQQTNLQYVYENGTFAALAAGNGDNNTPGAAGQYFTPASLDHAFSVSNVGWENPHGNSFNAQGVHEGTVGDSVANCYQHNSRVDILAPAIRIGAITADYTDTSIHYLGVAGWGTSFASPQVAGVAGLLHSVSPCLSPYQLEWILKSTANDSILSYSENLKYAGRLGAGALRAGAAVDMAKNHLPCNDQTTQTMFIQGVEVNTICAPGYSSNNIAPHLKPIITNGTAPYTARWVALPGNEATLSDNKAVEPDVTAATGGRLLYYHLTIYDASPVAQKVADKVIHIQLDTANVSDFAMRDSYVDMLDEPNSQAIIDSRNWEIWHSPDLWAREYNDSLTDPEPIEYRNNDSNYIYVRIRNIGCAVADSNAVRGSVHFYWTLASTGEHWDINNIQNDWTGCTFVPNANGGVSVAGGEISVKGIPLQLVPGASAIVGTTWKPHMPQDYVNSPDQVDVCLLARVTEVVSHHTQFGNFWIDKDMTIPETSGNEKYNITNNNNIVTRNLIVTNTILTNKGTEKHQVWVSNAETESHIFNLQLINDRAIHKQLAGDFSAIGYITLYLGDLFDRWVMAGSHGTYATSDEKNKTVTFDGSTTLELDGINVDPGEHFPVGVEIHLRSGAKSFGNDFTVHFRQFISDDKNSYADLYGNVSFLIKTPVSDRMQYRKANPAITETIKQGDFFVYPNPVNNILNFGYSGGGDIQSDITVTDIAGKTVIVKKAVTIANGQTYSINTATLHPGIYLVHFTNSKGSEETIKITKLN